MVQRFGEQIARSDTRPSVGTIKWLTTRTGSEQGNEQTPDAEKSKETTDYSYFKGIVSEGQPPNHGVKSLETVEHAGSDTNIVRTHEADQQLSYPKLANLQHIRPAVQKKSRNLATYVNDSTVLSNLVALGVNLSTVEKNVDVAEYLVKADHDRDITPYLMFLHMTGVADADLGGFLTKNASVFLESLENLQIRVDYLRSKKFDAAAIARIVTKAPTLLTTPVTAVDSQLGYLQREFRLTGSYDALLNFNQCS